MRLEELGQDVPKFSTGLHHLRILKVTEAARAGFVFCGR